MKLIIKLTAVFLLLTSPVFAQALPGDDPDIPAAPISDYVWVLAFIGLVYIFFRLRTHALQGNTTK